MTLPPRRRFMRGQMKHVPTLPPWNLKPPSTDDYWWSASIVPSTAIPTSAQTTTWWPPGVRLGPRPTRPYLPPHIIQPSLLKWDRKFPSIWFRTGGTRFTYAPEVVNYPITFDWHVPKEKRVDKYTQRPNWPLESPLFGSEQVYDYLEEVTLPPLPVSGETEYPITSTTPWWTFPPWWVKKIAAEVNGTTSKPPERQPIVTRVSATTSSKPLSTLKIKTTSVKSTKSTVKVKTTTAKTITTSTTPIPTTTLKTTILPQIKSTKKISKTRSRKVIHHKGPWWKLTIVEHLFPSTMSPELSEEKGKRFKRYIRKFRPLRRQNAFRRKWKQICLKKNMSEFLFVDDKMYNGREKKKLIRLEKEMCEIKHDFSDKVFFKGCLSNLSKPLLETTLRSALQELKEYISNAHFFNNGKYQFNDEKPIKFKKDLDVLNHLNSLYILCTKTFKEYVHKRNSELLFDIITKEIGTYMLNKLLNKRKGLRWYLKKTEHEEQKNVSKRSGSKLITLFEYLCKHRLLDSQSAQEVTAIFKIVYEAEDIHFLDCRLQIKSNLGKNINDRLIKENWIIRRKRHSKIDLDKPLNWSAQSLEKVVDEIVEELPLKSIKQGVKSEVISELYTNKLKKLGKTEVNREVISKMVALEAEEVDNYKLEQETENSVKKVVKQLFEEVLSTLRNNAWMKNIMIKLFEDGYSVDSVVETIAEQISIESLLQSMEKDGVNITEAQRKSVLSEFQDYKPTLNKLLKHEIQLWEYQLSKATTYVRRKRNVPFDHLSCRDTIILKTNTGQKKEHFDENNEVRNVLRHRRDVDDDLPIGIKGGEGDEPEYGEDQLNIDKELSALEKSPLSVDKKMKKLKQHLKYLQSQTENPSDIVFPDNFEEELMRTENYDEMKTKGPRPFKKRFQWNVRTRKPTVKIVTFLPKIRLTRGKPFVPLTTTEEALVIPETQPPTRKRRTKKPIIPKNAMGSFGITTLQSYKKHFWLDFTQKTTAPKQLRPLQRRRKTTVLPHSDKTFATIKTFQTMKFGKKTQKPVISLQEFLKRRDEFRKVREEVMWNKNFLTSSQEGSKGKANARAVSTEEEELSEDEDDGELSFDGKLSTEVKPDDFTLQPLSDFLFTRPTTPFSPSHLPELTTLSSVSGKTRKFATRSKVTRRKSSRKTGYTRGPKITPTKKLNGKMSTIEKPSSKFEETVDKESEKTKIPNDLNGERSKRDLSTTYGLNPFTARSTENYKTNADADLKPTLEPQPGARKGVTREEIELKIKTQTKNWGFDGKITSTNIEQANTNMSSNSFETYQQEHRKWFGERQRGTPVKNYDIDWDQMRRKLEVQEISAWQKQKPQRKPIDKTQLRKIWNTGDAPTLRPAAMLTTTLSLQESTISSRVDESDTPRPLFDKNYIPEFTKYKSKPFFRNYVSDENKFDFKSTSPPQNIFEPPFGKADRSGKTAFGRLYYQEGRRRHYVVHDNRDPIFDKNEIRKLINKTYNAEFRIKTHRRTHWHNRTFDPKYIFTQNVVTRKNVLSHLFIIDDMGKNQIKKLNSTLFKTNPLTVNDSQAIDPDFDNYVKILRGQRVMSLRPKHQSFKDKKNNTVIINKDNDTFILQRSNKVPWDNKTDLLLYKTYQRSRKRFYNKTIDIAFSYYIFHKFKCGNLTRDVGYGRMSNVVNRWYNRTFMPKFRPDMFFVHNRYKTGKEFNYYLNEFNDMHAMMSEGKFDPDSWAHLMPALNKSEATQDTDVDQEFGVLEKPVVRDKKWDNKQKDQLLRITSAIPQIFRISTTVRWKKRFEFGTTVHPFTTKKSSFFQSVKKKGFSFFKNLFTKKDSKDSS